MAIFKAQIQSEYVVIPNRLLNDCRLSFEAKGLLCLLLSLPADWKVNKEWIINQSSAGKDKITRLLKELQDACYVVKQTTHDEKGKITGVDWLVYPHDTTLKLIESVEGQNPPTVNTDDGKPATTKETLLQSKDNTNNTVDSDESTTALVEDGFNYFWDVWKDCKKKLGKTDTSPKSNTLIKKWKPIFNKAYFAKNSVDQFKEEVNQICEFCKEAHSVQLGKNELNRFINMQTGRFLSEKQWRDE